MQDRNTLRLSNVMARADGLATAEVDGEVVALSIDSGSCYGFDKIATHIWKLVETPKTVSELCEILISEYNVDAQTCEHDVLDLLEELCAEGLLVVKPHESGRASP
jgi:hypothetical protein